MLQSYLLKIWQICYFCMTLFMNGCLAKHWEGMLISYLTTQDTYLPFTELKDLYSKTEYKVVVLPKSAYMQSFQIGNDLEKAIWKERIEPYMNAFPVVSRCFFLNQ